MHNSEVMIGQIMRAGLFLSLLLVFIGGCIYLSQNGGELVNRAVFTGEIHAYTSIPGMINAAWQLSPLGIIQLGILVLVLTQVLRVLFTAIYFIQLKDTFFSLISVVIFFVLLGSFV